MSRLVCWFRGHVWRYDAHMWATGMEPHNCYVCQHCGKVVSSPAS